MAYGPYCMRGAIVNTKNKFFGPNGSGMGQIDMLSPNRVSPTQSDKAYANKNQPMKRSRDIARIFKKNSKLPVENIETLSQRQRWRRFFLQVRTW